MKIQEDLTWIAESSTLIDRTIVERQQLPVLSDSSTTHRPPWEVGLGDARLLRQRSGLKPEERAEPATWIVTEHVPRVDRGLLALGGRSQHESPVLALANSGSPDANRFAAARALWRFARTAGTNGRFLLTSARTPTQQSERSFAAEFLAPAEGIRLLLASNDYSPVELDEVSAISRHYGVNDWVVEYQIVNQLKRPVDDPLLGRSEGFG